MVTAEIQTMEQRIVRRVLSVEPSLTFTVEIRYRPDDNGYSVECLELRAFAFGETPEEAVENLLDVMIGIAETMVDDHQKYPNLRDPRLPYARFVAGLGDEVKLRQLLGISS